MATLKKFDQDALEKVFETTERVYAKKTTVEDIQKKIDDIVSEGGEPNVIEGVQVNGTSLDVVNKLVNILIGSGAEDGTISVNGVDISVTGLGDLAYASEVTIDDLTASLVETINNKADSATTLEGYGITDAMTATEIEQAIATAVADADHLKRKIVDSVDDIDPTASDADQYIYCVPKTTTSGEDTYDEYMIIDGKIERMGDWTVDLSDYATIAYVTSAITTALEDYMTASEVEEAISNAIEKAVPSFEFTENGDGNVITAIEYDKDSGTFTITKGITALTEGDFEEFTEDEIQEAYNEAEAKVAAE